MNLKKVTALFFLCSLVFAVFAVQQAVAQVGGSGTYQFLTLPISARVTALGGNVISTKDNDLNMAIVNPALLSDSMDGHVTMSYINYFGDINYGYAAYAKKLDKIGTISAGIHYLNYGNFIRADEAGNTNGTFGANEMSVNLSYARSVLDSNLTVGATLKTIYSHFDSYSSLGSAVDIGAIYSKPKSGFAIAAVLKNAGQQWKPYVPGNREKLPFDAQIGISKKLEHVPFRLSLVYQNLQKWDLTYQDPANPVLTVDPITGEAIKQNKTKEFADKLARHFVIGGEFTITKSFFLRAGYNYQRRQELKIPEKRGATGFSFGFGLRIYKFQFSYGRAVYSLAGASNNFSVSFDINNFYSKK
jgi:hypothetical protein